MTVRLPQEKCYAICASDITGLVERAGCYYSAVKQIARRYPGRRVSSSAAADFKQAVSEMVVNDLCCLWTQLCDRGVRLRQQAPTIIRLRRVL